MLTPVRDMDAFFVDVGDGIHRDEGAFRAYAQKAARPHQQKADFFLSLVDKEIFDFSNLLIVAIEDFSVAQIIRGALECGAWSR